MTDVVTQQMEMQAFERGRMQGELEAIRRLEAESSGQQLKVMAPTQTLAEQQNLQRPDIIEINRLTFLQRAAFVMGELTLSAFFVLLVIYLHEYRGNVGWAESTEDRNGDIKMFNTYILTFTLGLMCHSQAISNYRILPLNLNANVNRVWYILLQMATAVCYSIAMYCDVASTPEATFWSVTDWCFALGFAIWGTHWLYSLLRTFSDAAVPVKYEEWAEVNNRIDESGARRDIAKDDVLNRTLYAPAPVSVPRQAMNVPNTNAVPTAPPNAPRWAENPHTHAEDYFLLPRAKWAIVGFWSMGAAFLMLLSQQQHIVAAGHVNWAQDASVSDQDGYELSEERSIVGSMGVMLLCALVFLSYASIPPRTTLVKNGILVERRASISQTAETQLGPNIV